MVPSAVYLIQNNLLYVAASNLDVATYQITYQLKILTTAMFAVTMLNKKLISTQWLSLLILIAGVAMVQLSDVKENKSSANAEEQSKFIGFTAALTACCLSGFAGVYFEKILKGSDVSVWMRNVQLAMLSVPMGLVTSYMKDGDKIADGGFFHGYDNFVWFTVAQNALGGLLVAVVVKYADNILKVIINDKKCVKIKLKYPPGVRLQPRHHHHMCRQHLHFQLHTQSAVFCGRGLCDWLNISVRIRS